MTSGVFGDNTGSTVLNSVTCSGNETRILDCSYLTSDSIICSDHSAAVVCQGLTIFKIYCCNMCIYIYLPIFYLLLHVLTQWHYFALVVEQFYI